MTDDTRNEHDAGIDISDHTVPFARMDLQTLVHSAKGCELISCGVFDVRFLSEMLMDLEEHAKLANILLIRSKSADTALLAFITATGDPYVISGKGVSPVLK